MLLLAFILFGLAVYFFIRFIIKRDHGHKEPVAALFAAAGFGLLAVIAAGFLNDFLIPKQVIDSIALKAGHSVPASTLLLSVLGIGLIEETLKSVPLAVFIYRKNYFDELTDGIIYFGLAGLTFGIFEDISYTLELGGAVGISRILMAPYLHSAFCMLFGMALVRVKVLRRPKILVLAGFLAAVMAHATYDFMAFQRSIPGMIGVLVIAATLNILLFVFFRRSQIGDEKRGQSSIGDNKFCRHCGKANPERLLYCSYCGQLS